jgi:hypothetical protein
MGSPSGCVNAIALTFASPTLLIAELTAATNLRSLRQYQFLETRRTGRTLAASEKQGNPNCFHGGMPLLTKRLEGAPTRAYMAQAPICDAYSTSRLLLGNVLQP